MLAKFNSKFVLFISLIVSTIVISPISRAAPFTYCLQDAVSNPSHKSVSKSYDINIKFTTGSEIKPVSFGFSHGLIVFEALINGNRVWAILDNRMDDSLIDPKKAKELGLGVGKPLSPIQTPTGSLERRRLPEVMVEVPGQMIATSSISTADLSFISAVSKKPISLVIGRGYFQNLAFIISFSDKSFQIGPSGTLKVSTTALPLTVIDRRPKVLSTVDGRELRVTLDLGYNGDLILKDSVWKEIGNDDQVVTKGQSANLQGTRFIAQHRRLGWVAVGPFVASNIDASLQPIFQQDGDGIIGLGFLSHFDFAMDLNTDKIWLIGSSKL